jgi:flagellar biosynthesis protein FlhA
MKTRGRKPVLVIHGGLRRAVARIVGAIIPVIALEEIPESIPLQVVHTAGPGQSDG